MENFNRLWLDSGFYHLEFGQFAMLVVGFLLLFFAIRKGFEPLLLVPIGFGCILSNVPGAGLSFSALESALAFGHTEVLALLSQVLGAAPDASASELKDLYQSAGATAQTEAHRVAVDNGFSDGMLHTFYKVAIASGAAPLIIFMGVGAMTDFGPLLANPKTLFLGAAAQFGIFATVMGAVSLNATGLMEFSIADAAAVGIIGGADGPTAIYVASILAPD